MKGANHVLTVLLSVPLESMQQPLYNFFIICDFYDVFFFSLFSCIKDGQEAVHFSKDGQDRAFDVLYQTAQDAMELNPKVLIWSVEVKKQNKAGWTILENKRRQCWFCHMLSGPKYF